MITLKCKMCGGALELKDGVTVTECEYCGTKQTLPKLDDEKKASMFDRANNYRTQNEFDKAALIYENILAEADDEAEAYWGLCLCRYGIEYVVDPKTQKRIPTCHRTQFKSILDDSDYLAAIDNADLLAKDIYKSEAQYIDKVQKEILSISSKEEPFDIFICYKETDDRGNRTNDSVIAQDIYSELTDKGYKVFFARITLEDKLGTAYEPYIFAALNSAKIMLVVGTKPEHFSAVWVKNEWSRYLSLIEQGQKKYLIPCYKDLNPAVDMPAEFAALQSQDVSKIGYMQDLTRGIEKLITASDDTPAVAPKTVTAPQDELNGPDIIRYIQSIGTNDTDDLWPKGQISSIINKDYYSVLVFQVILYKAIGYRGDVLFDFTVYDEMGNILCHTKDDLHVEPDNDRFAQSWVLRGDDGSAVEDGFYKVVFSVNGSLPKEYNFKVVSNATKDDSLTYDKFGSMSKLDKQKAMAAVKGNKSFVVYLVLAFFLGGFGIHSFYAGKKGKGVIQLLSSITGFSYLWALLDIAIALFNKKIPD